MLQCDVDGCTWAVAEGDERLLAKELLRMHVEKKHSLDACAAEMGLVIERKGPTARIVTAAVLP